MRKPGPPKRATRLRDEAELKAWAMHFLVAETPDPERTKAELRAILVEHYRKAGLAIPDWLRGPAASSFLDDVKDGE